MAFRDRIQLDKADEELLGMAAIGRPDDYEYIKAAYLEKFYPEQCDALRAEAELQEWADVPLPKGTKRRIVESVFIDDAQPRRKRQRVFEQEEDEEEGAVEETSRPVKKSKLEREAEWLQDHGEGAVKASRRAGARSSSDGQRMKEKRHEDDGVELRERQRKPSKDDEDEESLGDEDIQPPPKLSQRERLQARVERARERQKARQQAASDPVLDEEAVSIISLASGESTHQPSQGSAQQNRDQRGRFKSSETRLPPRNGASSLAQSGNRKQSRTVKHKLPLSSDDDPEDDRAYVPREPRRSRPSPTKCAPSQQGRDLQGRFSSKQELSSKRAGGAAKIDDSKKSRTLKHKLPLSSDDEDDDDHSFVPQPTGLAKPGSATRAPPRPNRDQQGRFTRSSKQPPRSEEAGPGAATSDGGVHEIVKPKVLLPSGDEIDDAPAFQETQYPEISANKDTIGNRLWASAQKAYAFLSFGGRTRHQSQVRDTTAVVSLPSDADSDTELQSAKRSPGNEVRVAASLSHARDFARTIAPSSPNLPAQEDSSYPSSDEHRRQRLRAAAQQQGLSEDQTRVMYLVDDGHNVFLTGPAASGKTKILRALSKFLTLSHVRFEVISPKLITALHRNTRGFRDDRSLPEISASARDDKRWRRVCDIKLLLIDDINMVSSDTMRRLDCTFKSMFGNQKPFGGVQLVVAGDFHQLPPSKPFEDCITCGYKTVPHPKNTSLLCCLAHGLYYDHDKWAFKAEVWQQLGFKNVMLKDDHVQDYRLARMLSRVREGRKLDNNEAGLLSRAPDDTAIRVFPYSETANAVNNAGLRNLDDKEYLFTSVDSYRWNNDSADYHRYWTQWKRPDDKDTSAPFLMWEGPSELQHIFPHKLRLKIGMPVVLLASISKAAGLTPGSQGHIIKLVEHDVSRFPVAKTNGLQHAAERWVLTGENVGYRADEVKKYALRAQAKLWPVVRFLSGEECTIWPWCDAHELGMSKPYCLVSRTQIPLLPGWAISPEKTKGLSLQSMVIEDVQGWTRGKLYTAMSSARSMEALKVEVDVDAVGGADETVRRFMEETTWEGSESEEEPQALYPSAGESKKKHRRSTRT